MRKSGLILILSLILGMAGWANDYENAWKALHENKRLEAEKWLEKAMKDPKTAGDAYLTYLFLKTFEGRNDQISDFVSKFLPLAGDPNPYVYALWFNEAVLGDYGKKIQPHKLAMLEKLLTDPRFNGSIRCSAHYVKAMHFLSSNNFAGAHEEWNAMHTIDRWQLLGPFDNLSGSGFNKEFGALEHPEANAEFQALNNAKIRWFTPATMNGDGWVFTHAHIPNQTAVVYAQTFVYSPEDQELLLAAGCNGAIKVWVNDQVMLTDSTERVTELDFYKNRCTLRKGYNRVLVKLAYTDNSIPNFVIRFLDKALDAQPGLTFAQATQGYTKGNTTSLAGPEIRHFAEEWFEEKVKKEPGNFINYILLSQVYLRNKKTYEARKLIGQVLKMDPENSLLRFEYMQVLLKEGNRTLLMEEIERIKEKDPGCYLAKQLNIQRLIDEEKYEEAFSQMDEMEKDFGLSEEILDYRIKLYGKLDRMDDLVSAIKEGYEKYPTKPDYVTYMFNLQKIGFKDLDAALEVYKEFLKTNYNYQIEVALKDQYLEKGMKNEALAIMERMHQEFAYDPQFAINLSSYYFGLQDYERALAYSKEALELAPYVATYWNNVGVISEQLKKNKEAAEAYKKALYYDPRKYDSREKLRQLEKKKAVYEYFPKTDFYELIRASNASAKTYDDDYAYLLDEKFSVIYAEGASEEYSTFVVKVLTEKGIDTWKESYIPYNEYTQTLLIEKAEVVKKGGSKVPAERDGNQLVFTNLEAGDAVVFKYRIQNYNTGRLAKEFWDKYYFDSFNPSEITRYCVLADKSVHLNYKMANSDLKPEITNVDEFRLYTWEKKEKEAIKDEPFMPPLTDVGAVLHVSTLEDWNDVATWYSDLSASKAKDDYEVREVFHELFQSSDLSLPALEKAKKIYDYITGNVRYSSVSFRQSGFVPQSAAVTINTRLGDCKDLSTLFVSLGRLAGLDASLVLVDTRDNGARDLLLPSVEFNHCIVLLKANQKEYYIELTDNDLPFGCLPTSLWGALSLHIPRDPSKQSRSTLQPIPATNRCQDRMARVETVTVNGDDLTIDLRISKTGNLTSGTRNTYATLSNEKQIEEIEKGISGSYKNPLKVTKAWFSDLDQLSDSISYGYEYTVKNEVIEVGSMKMFKAPFTDIVATIDHFSADDRKFPIEYADYEDTDEYETVINVTVPDDREIIELPENVTARFRNCRYSIEYSKQSKNKLKIVRKAVLDRSDVSPAEYQEFKKFLNTIITAESKYIVFK